jgi:hypothetical protein
MLGVPTSIAVVLSALVPPPALHEARTTRRALVATVTMLPAAAITRLPTTALEPEPKRRGLTPKELAAIVTSDIEENQFLVTGRLTRDVYDESATFTDAIDTYTLPKWIKGTGALFVGDRSHVDIVGPVESDEKQVKFRFSETLVFNLPLIKPTVPLTGTLILTRGKDGLITKYEELWDTDVLTTLSKGYF